MYFAVYVHTVLYCTVTLHKYGMDVHTIFTVPPTFHASSGMNIFQVRNYLRRRHLCTIQLHIISNPPMQNFYASCTSVFHHPCYIGVCGTNAAVFCFLFFLRLYLLLAKVEKAENHLLVHWNDDDTDYRNCDRSTRYMSTFIISHLCFTRPPLASIYIYHWPRPIPSRC